jgi:hypothetical protein
MGGKCERKGRRQRKRKPECVKRRYLRKEGHQEAHQPNHRWGKNKNFMVARNIHSFWISRYKETFAM